MLDRAKVLQALQHIDDALFQDFSAEIDRARMMWERMCADPLSAHKIAAATLPWPVPRWQDALGGAYPVSRYEGPYTILGVDGSQIYPDKHQGTSCFLINIGSVLLHYGQPHARIALQSEPHVFVHDDEDALGATPDVVNCRREEFEFQAGAELSAQAQERADHDRAYLFLSDGSLIFWHLESKDAAVREYFLPRYCALLHQLYTQKTLCAGYISLPKNKELVNLIRAGFTDYGAIPYDEKQGVDHIVDTTIASFFLNAGERTTVFKTGAPIAEQYPASLVPHFFYLHVGDEIGRVEIPAWIANDRALVDRVAHIILDQALKGRGYPVVLAEAHEQAVVKGPDREFFYQIITKLGVARKQRITLSQKNMKKRGIGI